MTTNIIRRYAVSGDIAYPVCEDPEGDYVTYEDHVAAIEADRKTTEKQLTAYRGLVNSLEARLTHLQAQHDELKKSANPDLLASERAANAILTEELGADRKRRGEPVAWPTHEFAIVVDRMYEGEGPSLAMWNGENYQFSDGDCYDRETDGSLDGYTAEWLTHHQLEQRLFAPQPAEPVAYLDLGVGGYMDVGTALTDEQLAALPKGRHMLAIVGTYGVDGYTEAAPQPAEPCVSSVSDKTACGAQNAECEQQDDEPVKVPSDLPVTEQEEEAWQQMERRS